MHDGDYFRLLTPGEYEVTAFANGFVPQSKLVEVSESGHRQAPIVNFNMEEVEHPNDEVTMNSFDIFQRPILLHV